MASSTERTAFAATAPPLPVALKASVITLTANTRHNVEPCLRSLEQMSRRADEVIVVDNGSTDGSPDVVRGFAGVRLVTAGENLGYARANNFGAKLASGDVLVFLNDDVVVDRDWLAELLAAFESDPSLAGAQSLILLEREPELINTAGHALNYMGVAWCGNYRRPRSEPIPQEISAMSGASLAIRRNVFLDIGGFDEDFFMYHEDLELSWRLRLFGYSFRLVPASICYHKYDFKKPRLNKLYLVERNRLMTILQNYETRTLAVLAPMLILFELGACLFAARQHGLSAKVRGYVDLVRRRKQVIRKRRLVQQRRRVTDREFARWVTGDMSFEEMDSPLIRLGSRLSRGYWALAQRLIAA